MLEQVTLNWPINTGPLRNPVGAARWAERLQVLERDMVLQDHVQSVAEWAPEQ